MKNISKLLVIIFSIVFFSTQSFSQELILKGSMQTSLKGGYRFNKLRILLDDCTVLFITTTNKQIPYNSVFEEDTEFIISNTLGISQTFSADVIKKDIYFTPNYGYKIFSEQESGPDIDLKAYSKDSSILKAIVFIPSQTKQFYDPSLAKTHTGSFEITTKSKPVELPDGSIEMQEYETRVSSISSQTLTLMGFFYVLKSTTQIEGLCSILEIPFVKTKNNVILVPVGGKKAEVTRWMLKTFYGIASQSNGIQRYTFHGKTI